MEVAKSFTEDLMVEEAKRTFEFGGELFKWRYLAWDEFADGIDKDQAEITARANQNGETEQDEQTFRGLYEDYQKRIEPYLDPENEAIKRWRALTKRKTGQNPVPAHLYQALYMWLLEVTSGRPIELPSPSGDGRQTTAPTSKAGSS